MKRWECRNSGEQWKCWETMEMLGNYRNIWETIEIL